MDAYSPAGDLSAKANQVGEQKRSPRTMLMVLFLIMNLAIGLTYGSFGPLLAAYADQFETRFSLVSLCMSLIVLNAGLQGLVISYLMQRVQIRSIMVAGSLLAVTGYVGVAFADNIYQALCCFAFLIGPGVAFVGTLPCITLASNWFGEKRGRAIGIINMPIAIIIMPPAVTMLLPTLSFSEMMLSLAGGYLLILPLIAFVVDRPVQPESAIPRPTPPPSIGARTLIRDPVFLLLTLGTGLFAGAGVSKGVHYFRLLFEGGMNAGEAAMLMSISSGAGVFGSILFGALADRFNTGRILAIAACVQAIVWFILVLPANLPLLLIDAIVIGICTTGFVALQSVVIVRIYGAENLAAVMGILSLAIIPFLFGLSPTVGVLRDASGSYFLPVAMLMGGFVVAAGCFLALARHEASNKNSLTDGSAK